MKDTNIIDIEATNTLQELSLDELDTIIGAGKEGVVPTISHDCHMNSWQFIFTCCS
ncbi:type A2 lantipeptide [Atopobacter sp. AH10]|uniref:lacticin 481 family lantibiotic n=1 Tax=Atopobacter sp. AH10 TaxID=2315861 RepID=UPI000EF2492A|nr:lacticin 481 family lantibiotic [Atopobacter sp. AH10]RLK63763.1 type A2 lantipeptide [Atopobacter sp. AH10]